MNSKPGDERHLLQAQTSTILEKPREKGQPGGRRTQKNAEVVVGATSCHSHLVEMALALNT